jgi:ATP-binding cassette subfamily F protein uup
LRQAELEAKMSSDGFYQQDRAVTQLTVDKLASTQQELEAAFERWDSLEEKVQNV